MKAIKLLTTVSFDEEKIKKIENLGLKVFIESEKNEIDFNKYRDIDFLVGFNPIKNIEDYTVMNNLKWIHILSSGYNHVPLDYVKKRNILLTNNRGAYTIQVSEWIIFLILQIYKNAKYFYDSQSTKAWNMNRDIFEIFDKKIAIIGCGSIGIETAKKLRCFGTNIHGYYKKEKEKENEYFDQIINIKNLPDNISQYDILILSLPYDNTTYQLINKELLNKMKNESIIINISRGQIIDEKELIRLLKEGKFLGCGLDVFEIEPLEENSCLWDFERVYITPHNAWFSNRSYDRRFELFYNNLVCVLNKKMPKNLI